MFKLILLITIIYSFTACSSNNLNLTDYSKNINKKLNIDPFCKSIYTREKPRVAVVNFTNNSNFGVANVNNSNSNASVGIGVSIIGMGAGVKSNKSKTSRVVDAKLASAFIPLIEQMVMNTGGVKLFTRSDLGKVDTELKLQDSGLLDPSSVVEFGMNAGVQYIITGSIDYVEHNFKNYSKYTGAISKATMHSDNTNLKLASAAVHFMSSFFDGTTIKTAATLKIIDVKTGQIVFSKQIKNETKLKSKNEPTYGQLVGAIKSSISKALPSLQNKLQEQFATLAYVSKIKKNNDNNIIVQISLGTNDNITKGNKFVLQNVELSQDPLTNKKSCDIVDTNIIIEASKHISSSKTWAKVIEGNKKDIKLLQLAKKIKE
jgi:curli biogenesis system outer membrane secretion channel CsgG